MGVQASVEFGTQGALDTGRAECAAHAVVGFADEVLYLVLAFYDKAYGHRLHASGRERRFESFPEHGRKLESNDAVEDAACLLGVDAVYVDVARVGYGIQYGFLCDFVEHYAPGVFRFQFQNLVQVPCDGFSLAVFIGREPYGVGLGGGFAQFGHKLGLVVGNFVDAVVGAEELFYCFCLCGRFDDDKIGGCAHILFCFRTTKLHILIYIMCMPSKKLTKLRP